MASESHLPAEVLEKIFSFIGKDDVVTCSGVCNGWYETAKRRLSRKYGVQLCRFDRISSKSRNVCLAGDQAVQNFSKRRLRALKTLRLQYDEPGLLPTSTLDTIFASCKNLKHLELLNLTSISENDAEVILEKCRPFLKLRISLRDRQKSKEALAVLEEHRELLKELLVEFESTCEGWFPCQIPHQNSTFCIPEASNYVELECLSLGHLECPNFNRLRTLILKKCYALSDTSLYTISGLNITTLSIEGCPTSESTWLDCFKAGFKHLKTISITGCENLTPAVIEVLGAKNLTNIKLEINKTMETSALPHLYGPKLESLHIITDLIISNSIFEGVEKHWLNLKLLLVEDSLFSLEERFIGKIEALKRLCRLKKIEFIHNTIPSKIMETSRFKNLSLSV